MTQPFTIERVQALRRLTRTVSDLLGEQLTEYLTTLSPLFRPRRVLGEHVRGAEKEPMKGADRAFREMQALFATVARAQPFTLARELVSPVDVTTVTLQIHPVEYDHQVDVGGDVRVVRVRSPLSWVLSYSGHGLDLLPDLLSHRTGANEGLHDWLVHQFVVHAVVSNQPGLTNILGRLHFSVSTVTDAATGGLPITRINSPLTTVRPPDDVIMKSVEFSGMDAFEEVIDVDGFAHIEDPLKQQLLELAAKFGERPAGV
ncbi:MAG: hypothetical protein ABMA15_02930 [Vicinamibacterales bacterium]